MSREIPADVADLPTIEAEYWLTTTEDRVGMEGPEFDDEGNLYVCSVGMTYPINYILKVDGDKNITTVWEGTEANPIGGIYVLTAESGYKELTVLADKLPGTDEAYLMTAGFGEGSHIYVFETLAGK